MKPNDWRDIQTAIRQWAKLPEPDRPSERTVRMAESYAAQGSVDFAPLPDSVVCYGGEITFEWSDPSLKLVTFTADGITIHNRGEKR